jgi:predicted MPP superfamily phosphohydrolase
MEMFLSTLGSTLGQRLPAAVRTTLQALFDATLRTPAQRMQFLQGMGMLSTAGVGMAGYAFLREPLHVQLDRLTLHLPGAVGHLPPGGLRVLHLSDTHFRGQDWREQPKMRSILRACDGLDYDILVHTGDFLHYDSGLPNVLTLLDKLPRPRLGAYAVFGNHDYSVYSHADLLPRAWTKFQAIQQNNGASPYAGVPTAQHAGLPAQGGSPRRMVAAEMRTMSPLTHVRAAYAFGQYVANSPLDLKRTGQNNVTALEAALCVRGFELLHNRYVRLVHPEAGVDLYMAGVDDVVEGTPQLRQALAEIPYDAPTVLLSHNPDILTDPDIEQVDLVLSGHTHGGQIVLPLVGAVHTQTQHLHRREVSGYLRRGKTQVYITRGIGEGIPLRFGAAPQVTLLTLMPA